MLIKGEVISNRIYVAKNFSSFENIFLHNYFLERQNQLNIHEIINLEAILGRVSFLDGKILISGEIENKSLKNYVLDISFLYSQT